MLSHQFRYFGGRRAELRSGQEIFRSSITGRTSLTEKNTISVAALCKQFATLDEHAARIRALAGRYAESEAGWKNILLQAVENGLLSSVEDVRERVLAGLACLSQRRIINMVGIPTRNRPALLKRLLTGLAENLRRFERTVEVLIVDDSDSIQMQLANCEVISALADDPCLRIRYGNRDTRNRFAAHVARESGVPEEVVSFALANNKDYPVSTGAARNAILLESAGHCALYLDDDIQCRLAVIPGSREGVAFQAAPLKTWFFAHPDDIETCQFTADDLLGLHERVLNIDQNVTRTGSLDGAPTDISGLSPRFLNRIEKGNAAVTVSLMGIVGDSGLDDPLFYFLLGTETLARLTKTVELYNAALTNRQILRGPQSICVSDQCECHSGCMGVDNIDLLPPFMPVMRGQDLVFGSLVAKCIPGGLFGVVPRAILHQPAERREFVKNAASRRVGKFMTGETLGFLIGVEPFKGSSRSGLIRKLGARLQELEDQDVADFQMHIRSAVTPMLVSWMQQLDVTIDSHSKVSNFWIKDALDIKAAILSALNERDYSVPSDLEQTFGIVGGRERFRDLVKKFASLLQAWPAIVESTKALQAKGKHICWPMSKLGPTSGALAPS